MEMVGSRSASAGRGRLSRADWARAALETMRERGLSAVVVETLAEGLRTTKGSFYWHFQDRAELIAAALELWEQEAAVELVAGLEEIADPRQRLRRLFDVLADDVQRGSLHATLLSHAGDPAVGSVLRRVSERRAEFVTATLIACGLPPDRARWHAVLASAAYLGTIGLRRVRPDEPAFTTEAGPFREHVRRVLESELPHPEA
jgi:AcrR family transcriptional regulator